MCVKGGGGVSGCPHTARARPHTACNRPARARERPRAHRPAVRGDAARRCGPAPPAAPAHISAAHAQGGGGGGGGGLAAGAVGAGGAVAPGEGDVVGARRHRLLPLEPPRGGARRDCAGSAEGRARAGVGSVHAREDCARLKRESVCPENEILLCRPGGVKCRRVGGGAPGLPCSRADIKTVAHAGAVTSDDQVHFALGQSWHGKRDLAWIA